MEEYESIYMNSNSKETSPRILYHYTSYESARSIIEGKSLWLTKFTYLNDKNELILALELLRKELLRRVITSEKKKSDFYKSLIESIDRVSNINICIASFCENGDLLSQWRGYGQNGNAVSIGFTTEELENIIGKNQIQIALRKCLYDETDHESLIISIVNILEKILDSEISNSGLTEDRKVDIRGEFYAHFFRLAPIIKDRHFSEEKEWRIITRPISRIDRSYKGNISSHRCFEYYELDLFNSDKIFSELFIGPSKNQSLAQEVFCLLFDKSGQKNYKVSQSSIPFRG